MYHFPPMGMLIVLAISPVLAFCQSAVSSPGETSGAVSIFLAATDTKNSPVAFSGSDATAPSINGVLSPAACGTTSAPTWCAGSDIGDWINAAVSALPSGVVSGPNYGNAGFKIGTIELPNANGMTWSTPVKIGPGTNLIGHGKFSIFNCTVTSGRASVSNLTETSGSVVSLTLSPTSIFSIGQNVYLSGLRIGTWLNSQSVVVTSVSGSTITFSDPTAHGTQSPVREIGNATPSVACLTVDQSAPSGQFAHTVTSNSKLENFVIEGNGAAGQSVIKFRDAQGVEVHNVIADGATDAGQACFWLEDVNWWTERNTFIDDSSGYNCNIGWRFTSEASTSPHPSFGYNRFLDIKFNTAGEQTAFSIENNSFLYSGTYRITGNKGGTGSVVWFMSGKASFYENELQLQGEENGSGGYLLDITSGANQFTYWGNIIWGGGTPSTIAHGATVLHWLDSNYFTAAPNFLQNPLTWASAYTLPNGSNLNSVKSCGNYEVTSPQNGPSVSPSNALLHLQVVCAGAAGTGYVEQIVYQSNYTNDAPLLFERNSDGGHWGSWYTVYNGTAGSTNHATCWKAPGLIGYCASAIDSRGMCTCN